MENATKALTMAAGILIAMMVVSLIVVGINRVGSVKKVEQEALLNQELEKFNRNFESYNTNVLTGYKIISLANMAYDTNERYRTVDGYKSVEIYASFLNPNDIISGSGIEEKKYLQYENINNNKNGLKTYYNMIEYVGNGYGPYYELNDKASKYYRDKYFTCINIEYDDDSSTASGRIIKMVFDEIKKKE